MSYYINTPSGAATGKGNTGFGNVEFDLKRIAGFIMMPASASLTEADVLDIKTTLQTRSILDDRAARYHFVHGITGIDKSDTAPNTYTSGYGDMEMLDDGRYGMTFTFRRGGLWRHANLREFNNDTPSFAFYDKSGNILFTKDSSGHMKGITGKIFTPQFDLPDGSNPSLYKTTITLTRPEEINNLSSIGFVDTQGLINFETDIPGIINVELVLGTVVAGKVNVGIVEMDSRTNLYSTYDDEFASAALWTATKVTDGTAVTISAVAKDGTDLNWELSMTYTGAVIISLDGPTTLAAANIGGLPGKAFEAWNTVTATLPAP